MSQERRKTDTTDIRQALVPYLIGQIEATETGEFFFKSRHIADDLNVEASAYHLGSLIPEIDDSDSNSLDIEAWGSTQAITWMATLDHERSDD